MWLRRRRPLFNAFSFTAGALVFLTTGLMGYTLSKHDAFVAGTRWTGAVIWTQVIIGAALVPVAAFFWRRGLALLRRTG